MVYKDGVSNMCTQDIIKKFYKALMKNHHHWLVKRKWLVIYQMSQPNIYKGLILKFTYYFNSIKKIDIL